MDIIPALRMSGRRIAGNSVSDAVRTWVDAGFDSLQVVDVDSLGGAPADVEGLAEATAAARPEARAQAMVGWQDPDGLGAAANLDTDRIVLHLDPAEGWEEVRDCLGRNPGRLLVDLPLVDGSTVAAWPLDDDLEATIVDLTEWGVGGIVLSALDVGGSAMAEAAALARRSTDAPVLMRVSPGRLQPLHLLFTEAPDALTGLIIDPAESVMDVAEMAVALQQRWEVRRSYDPWQDHYFGPDVIGLPVPGQGPGLGAGHGVDDHPGPGAHEELADTED